MTHARKDPEQDLIRMREINETLTNYRLPLKRLAGRAIATGLSPELVQELNDMKQQLQQLLKILGGDPVPNGAALSQLKASDGRGRQTDTIRAEQASVSSPRPRNKGLDFLLLAAPYARERFGYPISHDVLFKLAQRYDPSIARPTMVSKVNRYKNAKNWLEWSSSEDIRITKEGETAYNTLRRLADRDGDLPRVKQTFRDVWKIDLPFD